MTRDPCLVSEALTVGSKSWLLDMPPELQSMIAGELDAVSLHVLKLVCKDIDTWTKNVPKLSASDWVQYNSLFERRRRNLQDIGCSGCKNLLGKGCFSDRTVHKPLNKGRLCISCAIQNGSHDKRKLKVNGQEVFGCRGCQEAKPLEEEATCVVYEARWYENFPRVGTGGFLASYRCRWCHRCWNAIQRWHALKDSAW